MDDINYQIDVLDKNYMLGLIDEKERDIEMNILIHSQKYYPEQNVNRVRQEYGNQDKY